MRSFFFRELQLITVLLLISDFYVNWSARFDSVPFLLKFIFLFNKKYELFDFKAS